MTVPKWTEERTDQLVAGVTKGETVTKARVNELAEELGTTARSISSKLRKLDYEVEKASEAPKAFSDDEAEELRDFVEEHDGEYTYAEIAENFAGGKFTARAVQGKILSMQLTNAVRPTPKAESTKTYTDEEAALIVSMVNDGAFLEDIADKLGKTQASVRGKALSLLRAEQISEMPKQREVKGQAQDAITALGDRVSGMTVAELVQETGKTERGIKTILTRRGLTAKDYDGAAKQKKAAE